MRELFTVTASVDSPVLIGQDEKNGRRQLILIQGGTISGTDLEGCPIEGEILPCGVYSQVIRPDGKCELSARYGIRLTDGSSFYIENNGIRTVPEEYVSQVLKGEFIDPSLYYFATVPTFEVYAESLRWLENHVFICKAIREAATVRITYYVIE